MRSNYPILFWMICLLTGAIGCPRDKEGPRAENTKIVATDFSSINNRLTDDPEDILRESPAEPENKSEALTLSLWGGRLGITGKHLLESGTEIQLQARAATSKGKSVVPQSCQWKQDGVKFPETSCIYSFIADVPSKAACTKDLTIQVTAFFPQGHPAVAAVQIFKITPLWCHFTKEDKTGLTSNRLTKLAIQADGDNKGLWVGTADAGLAWLKEEDLMKGWASYYPSNPSSLADDSTGETITALAAASDGGIWAGVNKQGSPRGVYRLSIEKKWITPENFISYSAGKNISHIAIFRESPSFHAHVLVFNYSRPVWPALSIFTLDGNQRSQMAVLQDQLSYSQYGFTAAAQWGEKMLIGVDAESAQGNWGYIYKPAAAIYSYSPLALKFLPLNAFAQSPWQEQLLPPGNEENTDRRVVAMKANLNHTHLWVGFRKKQDDISYYGGSGGLALGMTSTPGGDLNDAAQWKFFGPADGLPEGAEIRAIEIDKNSRVWLATSQGLMQVRAHVDASKMDKTKADFFLGDKLGLSMDLVDLAYGEQENALWVATKNNGLFKLHLDMIF